MQRYETSADLLWNGEKDVPEVYLHGKPPSLAQTMVPELELKLSDTEDVYRQVPYGIRSTSRELHGHTTAPAPAAEVESDIPELIENEDYQW